MAKQEYSHTLNETVPLPSTSSPHLPPLQRRPPMRHSVSVPINSEHIVALATTSLRNARNTNGEPDAAIRQVRNAIFDHWARTSAPFSQLPDEIALDHLYLSNAGSAANIAHMIKLGITHIINLACGSNFWEKQEDINKALEELRNQTDAFTPLSYPSTKNTKFVTLNQPEPTAPAQDTLGSYQPPVYLTIRIADSPSAPLYTHFKTCISFIESAPPQSRILVHCQAGISRSASIVIAYLMWKNCWRYTEAFEYVKSRRQTVGPNAGFRRQLIKFEEEIFGTLNTSEIPQGLFTSEERDNENEERKIGEKFRKEEANLDEKKIRRSATEQDGITTEIDERIHAPEN